MLALTPVAIDACVMINLAASGRFTELAAALSNQCWIADAAAEESLYLRGPSGEREALPWDEFFGAGGLKRAPIAAAAEEEFYVGYASELDDGEAMSLALARARGWGLATDDRKARRLASEAGIATFSTPAIAHAWAAGRQGNEVAPVLRRIESRAHYQPGRDPLAGWWRRALAI